jgi:NADP-dependent 3-hydroxy acid dehydrogenase YdfG
MGGGLDEQGDDSRVKRADAITYIVTRPRHVAVNEMLIRPTEQER